MKRYLWLVSLALSCLFTVYMLMQPPEATRPRQPGGERKVRDFLGVRAERVAATLAGKMAGIHQLTHREPAKTVFVEVWDEPFMTIGGKSYLSDIISQAGGINMARDKPYDYMACDFEMLYGFNPDVYIAVSHGG